MIKSVFSTRLLSCLLVILFSLSGIAASNGSVPPDKQKLYESTLELMDYIPQPVTGWGLDLDHLADGLSMAVTVVGLLEDLEPYMDVREKLGYAYSRLGEFNLYFAKHAEAEECFMNACARGADSDDMAALAGKLAGLEYNAKVFVCKEDGERVTEIQNPNVLYLGDLKKNQCFEIFFEITNNKNQTCVVHPGLISNECGLWAWEDKSLGKGDSYGVSVFSSDERLAPVFNAGFYYLVWTADGYPADWFDLKIMNGTSKDNQAAHKKSNSSSVSSDGKQPYQDTNTGSVSWHRPDLEELYDEFQKFWYVRDSYDLQDRFEEFLATKNIDPDDIEDYDDFIEVWTDTYDEDLDFDDLESYALGLYTPEDRDSDDWDYDDWDYDDNGYDEYDILVDDDVDILYDDYLDDYIDDYDDYGFYNDYGEYYDEVYYDW